ncbi:MAG: LytTR family DNA-binding domain-containing protein [Chitinophagaceae bacterium]
MKINCIIIDDEPLSRNGLKEYVQDTDFLNLVGEYEHPLKAMSAMLPQSIQLIFLDIQMPKLTGVEFMKSLQHPPLVIFTTAYPQYAIEGFDLSAVDYLLKPFSFDRFLKAAMKAKLLLDGKSSVYDLAKPLDPDHFFIKVDNKLLKIRFDEILYVEALQNYVAIHTASKKYVTYLTLKNVEEQLPTTHFVKIHKSYLVALQKVDCIEGNEVKIGACSLPISRLVREDVLDRILQNKLLKR